MKSRSLLFLVSMALLEAATASASQIVSGRVLVTGYVDSITDVGAFGGSGPGARIGDFWTLAIDFRLVDWNGTDLISLSDPQGGGLISGHYRQGSGFFSCNPQWSGNCIIGEELDTAWQDGWATDTVYVSFQNGALTAVGMVSGTGREQWSPGGPNRWDQLSYTGPMIAGMITGAVVFTTPEPGSWIMAFAGTVWLIGRSRRQLRISVHRCNWGLNGRSNQPAAADVRGSRIDYERRRQ